MNYLEGIDPGHPQFGDLYDELPLWSAPFGLRLLDRVPMKPGLTILDVGAGTGFLTLELAQRCGSETKVIAVDPWNAGMNRLRRKSHILAWTMSHYLSRMRRFLTYQMRLLMLSCRTSASITSRTLMRSCERCSGWQSPTRASS